MKELLRPYKLLPLPAPRDFDPGPQYFYENFVKAFIPDTIQMMETGLHVDQNAVEDLRTTVETVLENVAKTLESNSIIQQFQAHRQPAAQKRYEEKCTQAVRTYEYYLKEYKPTDTTHRSWVVNTYLLRLGKGKDCRDKWTLKDLKQYNIFLQDAFIGAIIDKRPLSQNTNVLRGMQRLAEYKAELWNKPRLEKAKQQVELDPFNPASAPQKQALFDMLQIEPLATSKDTGDASWGRDQLEELKAQTSDPALLEVLTALIDHSYSGIIRNNFIKAFDSFTIDGVLHGNIKLFGAKSFRPTSNSPNLLNAPSTGTIYAKPLKRCFIAPGGYLVLAADLSALEDRVIANLSGDENKLAVFLENLDGHSLSATYYFKQRLIDLLGVLTTNKEDSIRLKGLVDDGDSTAKAIRQDGKPVTFGLAYGAYPPKLASQLKCDLPEAERIFNAYHHELHPGITDYRENYVLDTTKKNGFIHLGLGCRMYSSDPDKDIRTLNNATVQFWSILTQIAINEFNHRIREERLEKYVKVSSSIYDSIYNYVYQDAEIIEWANNNLIECMTPQYLEGEQVHNEAEAELGLNWAELHRLPNNASISDIEAIIDIIGD